MGWIGKLVGGTIGLFIGGPLGAIAGVALGHGLDVARDQALGSETGRFGTGSFGPGGIRTPQQKAQLTFFVATFSMLAKLAQADGTISKAEVSTIEDFMNRDLHLDPISKQAAGRIFEAALSSAEPFEALAHQFYGQFREHRQLLDLLIDILVRVAAADGKISDREEKLILEAVSIFGFTKDYYRIIRKRYAADTDQAYAVLGCTGTDSNETIKKQYKKLVLENHPDRIASKGLPEEFTQYAADKFREIQEAYEAIRKERGFT